MKKLIAIVMLFITGTALAVSNLIYKPGTLCDKNAGFCADSQGVSVGITEMELGTKASQRLQAQINEVGIQNFDATTFTMSGGLNCNTKEKKCYTNRYDKKIDVGATKALFQ
jgi:hypothetical protein